MENVSFVERTLAEMSGRPKAEIASHFQHLEWILQQIEGLPSPEKEETLVQLILRARDNMSLVARLSESAAD